MVKTASLLEVEKISPMTKRFFGLAFRWGAAGAGSMLMSNKANRWMARVLILSCFLIKISFQLDVGECECERRLLMTFFVATTRDAQQLVMACPSVVGVFHSRDDETSAIFKCTK